MTFFVLSVQIGAVHICTAILLVLIVLSSVFWGFFFNDGANSAEEAAAEYLNALYSRDFDKMNKYNVIDYTDYIKKSITSESKKGYYAIYDSYKDFLKSEDERLKEYSDYKKNDIPNIRVATVGSEDIVEEDKEDLLEELEEDVSNLINGYKNIDENVNEKNIIDISKIREIKKLKCIIRIGNENEKHDGHIYCLKINNKWRVYDRWFPVYIY